MVGLDPALRRMTRDIGKLLQPYDFDGADPRWARVTPDGVAVVGRGRIQRTWTEGQQVARFGLAAAATPIAWWEFERWRAARHGRPCPPLADATGPGLVDARGIGADIAESWSLRTDPAQEGQQVRQADLDALRADLPRRVHAYARRALRLLEPDRYLDELLAVPDPDFATREAVAVLLAAQGQGPRLDEALARLRVDAADSVAVTAAADVAAYARDRVPVV
ncbi:hypothetical protein ACIA5E_16240 [Nocardia asteroides]|uniref:hypothetical protein n=1 Tax=Nocardia asteroides TaxID=1824 RepID=UPI00379EB311